MRIVIKTREHYYKEMEKHIEICVKMMEKQDKYNRRVYKQLQWRLYQLHKLERIIEGGNT